MKRSWDKLYSFTTENISGYLPLVSPLGSRVLSITGSGDHLLNAALYGGRHFTLFDCNPLSQYWVELKLAGVKQLSYNNFKLFFLRYADDKINSSALSYDVFGSLRAFLGSAAIDFFEKSYAKHHYNGMHLRNSELFNLSYDRNDLKLFSNDYLSNAAIYNQLRLDIQSCTTNYLVTCLTSLPDLLSSDRFDVILLSNISDYLSEIYQGEQQYLERYLDTTIKSLITHLVPGGKIVAAYLYNLSSQNFRSQIDDKPLRRRAWDRSGLQYAERTFKGVQEGTRDGVVVIKG